jgi:L-seryl-tRNA(Ser) seleniumtransferase
MVETDRRERLRALPSVDRVLRDATARSLIERYGHQAVSSAVRDAVEGLRARILNGESPQVTGEAVTEEASRLLLKRGVKRVVNATGVILHTNLGRSLLSRRATEAAVEAAAHYSNLEFDVPEGERGSRYSHAVPLLRQLTGAEDALVVNNCAAATLLSLAVVAGDGEVLVSRGQLVEIGGGFRIPEVMETSGTKLKEVGTTNRTRLGDYEQTIDEDTKAVLWVHQSNFDITGFTESTSIEELAALGLPVIADLGSGAVLPISDEPLVGDAVQKGADLVLFSGDKLLGGPQAGIVAGSSYWISRMRRHPLLRALRTDKLCLAALEATLEAYLEDPEKARAELPTLRMAYAPVEDVEARAVELARSIEQIEIDLEVEVSQSVARSGGGTLPSYEIPSYAVRLRSPDGDPEALAGRLRFSDPPVVGRVYDGWVWLDARTLLAGDEGAILEALSRG